MWNSLPRYEEHFEIISEYYNCNNLQLLLSFRFQFISYFIDPEAFCSKGSHAAIKSCCTKKNRCKEGQGDCDKDYHCESGLVCGKQNCDKTKFPSANTDCCEKPKGTLYTSLKVDKTFRAFIHFTSILFIELIQFIHLTQTLFVLANKTQKILVVNSMAYHMEWVLIRLSVATKRVQNVEEKVVMHGRMIKAKS